MAIVSRGLLGGLEHYLSQRRDMSGRRYLDDITGSYHDIQGSHHDIRGSYHDL
jgi:hypothetical protein